MKFLLRVSLVAALAFTATGCDEQVPLVCPAMPEVRFTPSPEKVYSAKDNLLVNIEAYSTEGKETFLCPSTICFTLDGSTPVEGRASTQCLPAPVKKIPVSRPVCIKYFVKGIDGTQSTVKQSCYQLEEAPTSACTPDSKASGEPLTVTLESSKEGSIFYTTDGTDPDPSGESPETQSGKAPVNLKIETQGTTTVRFRAQDVHGNLEPGINTCDYTYDSVPPTTLVTPAGSSSNDPIQVTLATNETARIYYTVDGSEPSKARLYDSRDAGAGSTFVAFQTAQIKIDKSSYLRFYAEDIPVGNAETPKQEVYFIGGAPAVKVEPGTGRFAETSISATLEAKTAISANQGTLEIYYTLDGTDPACSGTGTLYSSPITDMNKEGDYVLRYIACDKGDSKNSGVREATYTLGATGNPFFPELKFINTANLDLASSSKSIEVSTRDGFRYARLRRKIPKQIGTGVDGISQGFGFGLPLQYNLPVAIEVTTAVDTAYVHYVSGREISVYGVDTNSILAFGSLTFEFPEESVFDPCSQTNANGFPLDLRLYQDSNGISGIVPWTTVNNCGGFSKFEFEDYSDRPTHPYIRANRSQFSATQDDPPVVDVEEAGREVLVSLPKADVEVARGTTDAIAYVPILRSGNRVDGFYMSSGNRAVTSSATLSDRAIALDLNIDNSRLAVGDQSGNIYVLDASDLSLIGSAVKPDCEVGFQCRVNDLTWYRSSGRNFILAAIGAYGDTTKGHLAIVELTGGGSLSVISSSALDPASDPYVLNGVLESVQVIPNSDYALLSVRQQGIVVVKLDDMPAGNVSSRGYANAGDIGDNQFWAIDSAPYLPLSLVPRAAVLDAGRTNQGVDAGFRVFEFDDIDKFETTGTLLTANLNTVGKGISRVKLVGSRYWKDGSWYDDVLPAGLSITLIGDEVENSQPLNVGGEIAFPSQPLDVRAKLSFASPDTGDTTVRIDYLQFKFTPVE